MEDREATTWRLILIRVLRYAAALYLAAVLMMSFLERRLVYPAPPVERGDWSASEADSPTAPRDVWIASEDGVEVHGWFYDAPEADRVVLYCHGNGDHVADSDALMRTIRRELKAAVLVFDYRGYGKTRGPDDERPVPTERAVLADGAAAQFWLAERTGRRADELVIIGRSLGGGVATALAAEHGAAALLLQDTFTRLTDAAAYHHPWLPVRWIMTNRYDSLARIVRYQGPLIVSHAEHDRVVPFSHAKRLFDACPSRDKRYLPQATRGHLDPMPIGYWVAVREMLEISGGRNHSPTPTDRLGG
ncbi:MAG: alpha/beta hydrolase [Planctomycetota bacterium]